MKAAFSLVLLLASGFCCANFIKPMKVYLDEASLDHMGYNDCDGARNGEYNLIEHVVFPRAVVFDVGANIGSWSQCALKTEPSLKLFAFEPIPATYKQLQRNVPRRKCHLFNLALALKKAVCEFNVYADSLHDTGCSSLYSRPVCEKFFKKSITVNTQDLDSFCQERGIRRIDFLKIDTEGAELSIFKGATNLLRNKSIRVIQFEYGGCYIDAHATLKEVYDLLTGYNYTVYRIVPDGLVKITQWRPELETFQYSNYAAILN